MEDTMYVEIVFPLSLHQAFTYSVPQELGDVVQVGQRVIASLGRRKQQGMIIAVKAKAMAASAQGRSAAKHWLGQGSPSGRMLPPLCVMCLRIHSLAMTIFSSSANVWALMQLFWLGKKNQTCFRTRKLKG